MMSQSDDKRELLKLRQGLTDVDHSDIIRRREVMTAKDLQGKDKWSNFWFHYKFHVIFFGFLAAVAAFLIYDFVSRTPEDMRVLTVTNTQAISSAVLLKEPEILAAFRAFAPDVNSDGTVHVNNFLIDLQSEAGYNPNMFISNQTKLYGEMQTAKAQLVLCTRSMADVISDGDTGFFVNLAEVFPDCDNITEDVFFRVKGSSFAAAADWEIGCPDDLFLCVRGSGGSEGARQDAIDFIGNVINNVQNQVGSDE
jgi:hypothetical protein